MQSNPRKIQPKKMHQFKDYCANCRKNLATIEKILFVEQEIGRPFCSTECICEYFLPTVELMAEDCEKLRSDYDIPKKAHENYLKYRALTLQDSDEIWVKQTDMGDHHYAHISTFNIEDAEFHYVVVCLSIQGEPSFVFLSFPTTDHDLLDFYRDGIELKSRENALNLSEEYFRSLDLLTPKITPEKIPEERTIEHQEFPQNTMAPCLDTFQRVLREHRHPTDIPENDFCHFEIFVDPTLEDPDEIWTMASSAADGKSVLDVCTFITRFSNESAQDFYMIVVTTPEDQDGRRTLSVALAFPTIDQALVQLFRKGINSTNKAFGIGSMLAA